MDLYGTNTSPFVRRVRVVALEKGVDVNLIDVFAAEGQAKLRALTPVWKVPTARFDDGVIAWDSRTIIDVVTKDGWGPMRPLPLSAAERVDEENTVHAVDEAVLALVHNFYVAKDGFPLDAPWQKKQAARALTILEWCAGRVRVPSQDGAYVGPYGAGHGFGLSELALATALGWIRFRNTAPIDRWPSLVAFESAWAERPSMKATRPPA